MRIDVLCVDRVGIADGCVAGAFPTLHAPRRMGERLSALRNYEPGSFETIVGHSAEIEQLKQRAARMALADAPLLITGETGTGKELLAHACHAGSRRAAEPFLERACAQTARGPMRLSSAARAALLDNPWVGNVRELQNVIFRAVAMAERNVINAGDLELAHAVGPSGQGGPEVASLEEAVAAFEKDLLQRLYKDFPSSRRLARRLGASRTAIATRLRRDGIG